MTPLVLTGAIPGLLRRGSPVSLPSGGRDGPDGTVVLYLADSGEYATASLTAGPWVFYDRDDLTLDLTNPLGLHTAVIWLRERGHEVPATWPVEVVAWSVLSVSRGGEPINKRILTWWLVNPMYPDRHFRSVVGTDHNSGYASWYVNENRWRWGFAFECGGLAQTEAEGKALADAAALAANYALTNADGTLTLPPLPEAAT
jgi:hypothetical protein